MEKRHQKISVFSIFLLSKNFLKIMHYLIQKLSGMRINTTFMLSRKLFNFFILIRKNIDKMVIFCVWIEKSG